MSIHISNAGLVLLHPFLPNLFKNIKLTENNKWVDKTSQDKAVLILEFLAKDIDYSEEHNPVISKILCGIEIDEIIETKFKLDEAVKKECEALLNEVIRHWSVLKKTSASAFRENFLLRHGELTEDINGWHLKLEQRPIDILIDQMPWSIAFIKLPWMKKALYSDQ